jgi:hypothetical protein
VPHEVTLTVIVSWKREEKRRTIESVLFAKLHKLFWSGLLTQNRNSGIAGDEFD